MLRERAPRLSDALAQLPSRAGEAKPADRLKEVARVAVLFYRQAFPMAASLFASPDLLATHRRKLELGAAGPHEATQHLAAYLSLEQSLGRISPGIDPHAAATLLIGACFHRAFLDLFYASEPPEGALRPETEEDFATEVVRALLDGIKP